MKIIISPNAGYCMGVKRAFSKSFEVINENNNTCIYGEMVHNRFALKTLEKKGIIIIKDIKKIIKNKKIKNVIIRAHGIPPSEEKLLINNNKVIYDFTCPKVKEVQLLAKKLSNEGYTIILFGKKAHPEVKGILGYSNKPYYVIKSINEISSLPIKKISKPAILSQTTMNSDVFKVICDTLKRKLENIEIYDTLCNSPKRIQESALKLAEKVEAMIVVGDKLSANTTTLFEKLNKITRTFFYETKDDINKEEISKFKIIGITGGSSTPEWQMELITDYLKNL